MEDITQVLSHEAEGWRSRARRELTVIIPAYGSAEYLRVAVASALHGPAARILIAPGRETLDAALRLEAEHARTVRVVGGAAEGGPAGAINEAAAQVETPFFVRVDGEDILVPGFLESAFAAIASRPRLAIIAGHELRVDADEVTEFRPGLLPSARSLSRLRVIAGAEAYRFILQWRPNPCPTGAIYRTQAFREVGGYDEQIAWGEDWEIWLRLAREWEVAYTNTASALRRIATPEEAAAPNDNRDCYGYDAVYRRAAEICDDPEVVPLIRRAFIGVAKQYVGAASREARRSRKESLTRCRQAWRALSTAMAL